MQDLPVILKLDNLQCLGKALDFFIALKFCKSDFFLNRHKNVRWPLITSFQCILCYDKLDSCTDCERSLF